jgi:hypothetical protein
VAGAALAAVAEVVFAGLGAEVAVVGAEVIASASSMPWQ